MAAFRRISTFKGSQSSNTCQESTNRHMAVDTSPIILLCWDYYLQCIHTASDTIKLSEFSISCTSAQLGKRSQRADGQQVCWLQKDDHNYTFYGQWSSTTSHMFDKKALPGKWKTD